MSKHRPALVSDVHIAKRKFAWVCKSCERGNWPKTGIFTQSCSHILCWNQTKPRGIFLADPVLQMADLLVWSEAIPGYRSLHSISSVDWKQRFDCLCLSEMIYKTVLCLELGEEKHLCSYLRSSLYFFKEKNVMWLNQTSRQRRLSSPVPRPRAHR